MARAHDRDVRGVGVALPSQTIYEQGPNHAPTPDIFYPTAPTDPQRRFNAALMDVEVFAEGIDRGRPTGSRPSQVRVKQQSRHPDGTVFSAGESRIRSTSSSPPRSKR